jgi:hypothetical protein
MKSTLRTFAAATAGGAVIALSLTGIAWAITSNVFQYSAPKPGWYGLSPRAFSPESHGTASSYFISTGAEGHFLAAPDGNGCFFTGVNLPHGAKITALAAWYRADESQSVRLFLHRSRVADGTTTAIGTALSTDTSLDRSVVNLAIPDSEVATVNNKLYVYSAAVCFFDPEARYYAGRITYSYTNAGD